MGHIHEQGEHLSARAMAISRPDQNQYAATLDGEMLLLQVPDEISQSSWLVRRQADKLRLEWASGHDKPKIVELLAAIEAAFIYYPSLGKLDLTAPVDQTAYLLRCVLNSSRKR